MKIISCIFLSFLFFQSISQGEKNHFILRDSLSGSPLPFATILGSNPYFITTTNAHGEFEVDFGQNNENKIAISYVGYKTLKVLIKKGEHYDFFLSPQANVLDSVIVVPDMPSKKDLAKAEYILKEALKSLEKNSEKYKVEGDYKHRIKVNGQYTKLKDGRILLTDKMGLGSACKSCNNAEEIIDFIEQRNSLDLSLQEMVFFGTNYSFYINEFDFLRHNRLRYDRKDWNRDTQFHINKTLETSHRTEFEVSVDMGYEKSDTLFGKLFVMAEMKFQIEYEKASHNYYINSFEKNYLSKRIKGYIQFDENNYFKIDIDNNQTAPVPINIHHLLYQQIVHDIDTATIEATHQMIFDNSGYDINGLNINNSTYNASYWNSKPLSRQEYDDLGKFYGLEEQFSIQNDFNLFNSRQEETKVRLVEAALANLNTQTQAYLIFWNDQNDIKDYLLNAAYLIPTNRVIFIYTGSRSKPEWRLTTWTTDLMYFPNLYVPNMFHQLLEEDENSPVFKLINSSQKTIRKSKSPLIFEE